MITITSPGVYPGIADEDYHSDPVPAGSLSSGGARNMLQSPAWFRHRQMHREVSKPFDIGHAVHVKVLGIGLKVTMIPSELLDVRGGASRKDCKAWIDEARAEGLVPLKETEFYPVERMSESILAHPTARRLLEQAGTSEASVFAIDPETGEWMRARFDRLPDPGTGITEAVDVKTTAKSADPRRFGRAAASYGYYQQEPWYTDALALTRGDEARMTFIAVENFQPWLVSVSRLPVEAVERGRELNRRALDLWHECRQTGMWPGYGDEIQTIEMPSWVYFDADDDVELKLS